MCEEATRISCGPFRVPATYEVVRSSGTGRMTTRALIEIVVVGVAAAELTDGNVLVFKRQIHSVPRSYRRTCFGDILEEAQVGHRPT